MEENQTFELNTESMEPDTKIRKALEAVIEKRNEQVQEKAEAWKKLEEKRTDLEKLRKIPQVFSKLDEKGQKELCDEKGYNFLIRSDSDITKYSDIYQNAIDKLKALEARFGRKTVNLVVIGSIGAGKSKFLQSVSGLDDDCIPSFMGPSCTGITSVIENVSIDENNGNVIDENWIETIFTFKTKDEVLEDMNNDVAKLIRESGSSYPIPEIVDFAQCDSVLHDLESQHVDAKELIKIYITNRNEWLPYLDASLEERLFENLKAGKSSDGTWTYTLSNNKPEIKKFVAKHDGKEERTCYYRYVAVKNAVIRTRFPRITAKVRLIDTVGIGDPAGDTEKRMQTAISNDADGIIFVLDGRNKRTNTAMDRENAFLMKTFQEIYNDHKEEHAAHWMSLLINHEGTGNDYLRTVAKPAFGGEKQILGSEGICPENQRAVNVANASDALEMVTDFLYQISRHLDKTDGKMKKEAKELQEEAEKWDAEFRGELAKIRIRTNATEKENYIAKLTEERLCRLKESLEGYAQEILKEQNTRLSFLEESLQLIQDMIDEKEQPEGTSDLQKIIGECHKQWGGFEKQRAAVFQKTRDRIREIGARTPSNQELASRMFKQRIAGELKNNFELRLDKMNSSTIKPFNENSLDFFQKIPGMLLEGQHNAEDICSAFQSIDQFRLDTYNGITKALFNHFAAICIKDDPYAEPAPNMQTTKSVQSATSQNDSMLSWLTKPAPVTPNESKDEEALLLKELKNKLQKFKSAVGNQANNEMYLVSENDQKYEELACFIQVLGKEYYSPWEKVFSKLSKEHWINEFEPDKEHQKLVFEVANELDTMLKNVNVRNS